MGAPAGVVGDIRERRYGPEPGYGPVPTASEEWLAERGELARAYVRLGIHRTLGR